MSKKLNLLQKDKGIHWIFWMAASFFAATAATLGIVYLLRPFLLGVDDTVLNTIFGAVIYILLLLIAIGIPVLVKKYDRTKLLKLLGLDEKPRWRDLGRAVLTFLAYYGILFAVIIAIQLIFSIFGADGFQDIMSQEQEIGFDKTGNDVGQLVLIFLSLVIIPPLCEEIVMRGFLFGKLSKSMQFWPAAILTSLVFAIAHWQLNVGIDTFVLSMVLCYVRVRNGSIWSGIFVHMMKNGLAFVLLFTNWVSFY
ncbi:MAG: CPBP family intramembrane metalloprotease [Candidatus Nomurabacteria bacterium]|jgi:membrane protease YdiL (CAAX protease family)|nr:CPBP family intramembrane metalloprotease [Candidatus Nomurabacteria bacterium]